MTKEKEFLLLTDEEVDEKARDYILDSVWAFNSWFLLHYLPGGSDEKLLKIIHEKCEGVNKSLKAMIKDLNELWEKD